LEREKLFYISSDANADEELRCSIVAEFGGQVLEQVRRLGVGHTLGNRNRIKTGVARINKALMQIGRIRHLQKCTKFAATKILQQGVMAGAMYVIEHFVLPEAVWTKLRNAVVRASLWKLLAV
jgi:hypothetical protein